METSTKTKIIFITVILLILGILGGWIFVIKYLIASPSESSSIQADVQQQTARNKQQGTGTNNGEIATGNAQPIPGIGESIATGQTTKPTIGQSDNQEELSSRAFRILLPPGHREETRKRIVKNIYKQQRIIAIPTIASTYSIFEEESRILGKYSIILQPIHQGFSGFQSFQRNEDTISLFHPSTQQRPGGFLSVIPFSIDPMVLLVHKDLDDRFPLSLEDIQRIITYNTQQAKTNSSYILDKWHLIRVIQKKASLLEFDPLSFFIIANAIDEENKNLFTIFTQTKQYSSTLHLQENNDIQATTDICKDIHPLQCAILTQQPRIVWGWMHDLLGGSAELQKQIMANYHIQAIPSVTTNYPYQGRGWVIQETDIQHTQLAQQWLVSFLQYAYQGTEDIWPESFSAFQSIFTTQKNLEQYRAIKPALLSLGLLAEPNKDIINESLLKVLEGNYNPDIWLRKQRELMK